MPTEIEKQGAERLMDIVIDEIAAGPPVMRTIGVVKAACKDVHGVFKTISITPDQTLVMVGAYAGKSGKVIFQFKGEISVLGKVYELTLQDAMNYLDNFVIWITQILDEIPALVSDLEAAGLILANKETKGRSLLWAQLVQPSAPAPASANATNPVKREINQDRSLPPWYGTW